jgi:hypothetical protein
MRASRSSLTVNKQHLHLILQAPQAQRFSSGSHASTLRASTRSIEAVAGHRNSAPGKPAVPNNCSVTPPSVSK